MSTPSSFSVTSDPCRCGNLERQSREAEGIIQFDEANNEYNFSSQGFVHRIYHCPWCGGTAPKSRRPQQFVQITFDEERRIATLMEDIKTIRDALRLFGDPDEDEEEVQYNEDETGKQTVERLRTICYQSISPLADICITEKLDGRVTYLLRSKWIDTSRHFDWSTVPRHLHPDYLPYWKKVVLRMIGVKRGTKR
jgi:hypothetical protein